MGEWHPTLHTRGPHSAHRGEGCRELTPAPSRSSARWARLFAAASSGREDRIKGVNWNRSILCFSPWGQSDTGAPCTRRLCDFWPSGSSRLTRTKLWESQCYSCKVHGSFVLVLTSRVLILNSQKRLNHQSPFKWELLGTGIEMGIVALSQEQFQVLRTDWRQK